MYLVEFVLLEHFLLDKRLDWSLPVIVVDIHCFCGVARNDFLNHRVEFLKRRGIRGVVAFYLQIHLCVEILLHCFEGFKTSLILLAAKNDEHEIKRADKQERDKMHRAHFGGGKNPVTPEREQCKQHERYAEEHARAYVIVLFDQLVVNGRVADYVAWVTETNAEILHPCVTKGLRRFFWKTMGGKIADVVVVNGIDVCKIFSDFSAWKEQLACSWTEQCESNNDAQTGNHRQDDDEKQIRIDFGKFLRHFRKPSKRLFEKFHDCPPFRIIDAYVDNFMKYLYNYT